MLVLPAKFAHGDLDGVPFRQAKNYTKAHRKVGDVLWVVIHTAETSEVLNAAENLAAWAAGSQAPRASWHFAVDLNSITQSVREHDVAWHAPGANARGIGVECAGRAGQVASQWDDLYSRGMLARAAALVAGICLRWDLPIQRLGPAHLLAGTPGICGHYDVTKAFKKSSHVDPGKYFPWDGFLDEVQRFYRKSTPCPLTPRIV
jgi:N-acetyl-anhydromuramyl-L-alanine amidase AmpD